ncbi:hypothetical protein BDN72DRAFT_65089 [Pluteus cervinus]|uniref:Uncharacterized protein n=1 Tax=Pluteus cervinus TaxID=181527 RepID=A0ACD2ZZT4_9AGAR|nr:hypothetical protein BDN72DRAFT_65089 [Pluteus cervinus]
MARTSPSTTRNMGRPQLQPIPIGKPMTDTNLPRIHQQAITALQNRKYVALWFFTVQGIKANEKFQEQYQPATRVIVEDNSSLKVLSAEFKNGKYPQDSSLSLEQVLFARHGYILWMAHLQWPDSYIDRTISFFYEIETHKSRSDFGPLADRALVEYQAHTRQRWFNSFGTPHFFDIGTIQKEEIEAIIRRISVKDSLLLTKDDSYHSNRYSYDRERDRSNRFERSRYSKSSRSASPRRSPSLSHRRHRRSPPPSSSTSNTKEKLPKPCIICLGRTWHKVSECKRRQLWDKSQPTRTHKNRDGFIVNKLGNEICFNFQFGKCSPPAPGHIHECSGCGSSDHGAYRCALAEPL